jgi:hypothetical protein
MNMKKTTAMLLLAGTLAAGICHAGLQTVFYDDFSSGNLNAWSGAGATGNAVINYAGNQVLDMAVNDDLYHDFSQPYINNPGGPEWRLSFKVRSPEWAGGSFSYVKASVGTSSTPYEYGWWLADAPGAFGGDKSNVTVFNLNFVEPAWGTDSITGTPVDTGWYTVTIDWEASALPVMSAVIKDANGATVASNTSNINWFTAFDRLTFGGSLLSGK